MTEDDEKDDVEMVLAASGEIYEDIYFLSLQQGRMAID